MNERLPWRWGVWTFAGTLVGLAASVLLCVVPALGWLSGLAILSGAIAYALMAMNLFLAIRRPVLERMLGPLDRVYNAHRLIGTGILGVLGLHLVLIPIASVVDRGKSIVANFSVALPLGALGTLLLVASIGLALNTKVPYHKWQRVHLATGGAFLLLTAHMVAGSTLWFSVAGPVGIFLVFFALLGIGSLGVRVAGKAREGVAYVIVETLQRARGLEVVMRPEGSNGIPLHRPGQFVFLTATVDGANETHPFTLTSPQGEERVSVLIRSSGDWTSRAQAGIKEGDRVRLDGPFGAFTPTVGVRAPEHQVWVAGGAGITPFLSVLRTAKAVAAGRHGHAAEKMAGGTSPRGSVELIIAARDASDIPCWEELSVLAQALPWLTLTPAFSELGGRLDSDAIDRLATRKPSGTAWYLCGPIGLAEMVEQTLNGRIPRPGRGNKQHPRDASQLHVLHVRPGGPRSRRRRDGSPYRLGSPVRALGGPRSSTRRRRRCRALWGRGHKGGGSWGSTFPTRTGTFHPQITTNHHKSPSHYLRYFNGREKGATPCAHFLEGEAFVFPSLADGIAG